MIGQWLDGSRRRQQALTLVEQAQQLDTQILTLADQAEVLAMEAAQLFSSISPWQPTTDKLAAWRKEDEALTLKADVALMHFQQVQLYRSALTHKADLAEAHAALAAHYRQEHQTSEERGETDKANRYQIVLREHVNALPGHHEARAEHLRYLDGTGTLTLDTQPSNVHATLIPYEHRERRLQPGPEEKIGQTPLLNHPILMGTFAVRLECEGYHPALMPVHNKRATDVNRLDPDGQEVPVELLPLGLLGPDDCYVPPAGVCWVAMQRRPTASPQIGFWIDGFVMRRFAITHREYLDFLNALVHRGDEDEALRRAS